MHLSNQFHTQQNFNNILSYKLHKHPTQTKKYNYKAFICFDSK